MYELSIWQYAVSALAIWVALLSFFLIRAVNHYRKLARGENIRDLGKILERIVKVSDLHTSQVADIAKELAAHKKVALGNFSKYELLRFNPFEESGGDQSFVIVLLNSRNDGIVLSSLHSRSGTRIYAKEVKDAKATNHKFSKEEKEAVEKSARQVSTDTGFGA